ncbi:unnamed protein product [Rotaria sordida]|uniref:TFIIE beta domain-containing protein n=1 Tax=Rotaria sordida TaxID=392033 RepID=A0A814F264_9BILA|nr:unnamed protein product [Rotaria sordida]
MLTLSEKFHEQDNRFQQQFDEWTPFEQIYASVELTKKLQLSYRYFLSQLLSQTNNQQENNDMFHHTIHQANAPAILACLLSDPLDKIISTLQLYLPLVSITTTNEKLLDSYRDVFIYLDSKLNNPTNFSYTEQQLINFCQQIKFYIQTNPCLQKFLVDIPQLNALASSSSSSSTIMINKGNTDEKSLSSSPSSQRHHQPLQRYPSVRLNQQTPTLPASLMNFSSEGSHNSSLCQQLIHHTADDSGVDLTEPNITNSVQNILSTQDSQHTIIGRSHSDNLTLKNGQDNQNNYMFVGKSASSPTPEPTISNHSSFVPLSAVLSAPAPSIHSYYSELRHQNSNYQQQIKTQLPISDEDEEDFQQQQQNSTQIIQNPIDNFYLDVNTVDNRNRLGQYRSLCNRNTRKYSNNTRNNTEIVSPYLGVDSNSGSITNKFLQPNSGMRDVPKWLKTLRLHKYAFFFSQMTYDQMMSLTYEQLKEGQITDGACTKILLNIKKLKERQTLLQKCLIDIDNEQIDIKIVLQQLNELMLTPIRVKQTEKINDNDEDLPKLIMQVLEKVYQKLTCNNSSTNILSEMCNNLVGLFDRCYKHEAFTADQRHTLLHWRGPLCNKLQTSGKIDFKSMQSSSSSLNRRVQLKPQTSMGNINTTQISRPTVRNIKSTFSYFSNYPTNSIPLSRQHNSELLNQNGNNNSIESNINQHPIKSPTLIFSMNDDYYNDSTTLPNHLSLTSTPSLQEQLINHQTTSFLTERTGNFRPSFNYIKSTTQNNINNGTYLATNQHQLLTRKKSIDPYGEINLDDKTKLCKTYSDPNKIRYYNSIQTGNIPSTTHTQISPQQTTYGMTLTPYSSQKYLGHTQSTFDNESTIRKSYSDTPSPIFYERANFLKRQNDALAFTASNEKRQKVEKTSSQKTNRPKPTFGRSKTSSDFASDYHTSSTSSKSRFLTLANIVEKLQERFLSGQTDAITLDEIIEESSLTIDPSDKHWLASEALLSNEKIDVKKVDDTNKFVYKPPLDLKAPKKIHLLNLLKTRHERCEGAVTVDDVRDTIPKTRADNIIDSLIKSGDVVKVTSNKKDILFYTDRAYDLRVNPEFIESWRKISVEGLDDKKIWEFLDNQGHYGLTKNAPRQALPTKSRRGGRRPDTMKHNLHVAHQLEDYSNTSIKKINA